MEPKNQRLVTEAGMESKVPAATAHIPGIVEQLSASAFPPVLAGDAPAVTVVTTSAAPVTGVVEGYDTPNVRFYGLNKRVETQGGNSVIGNVALGASRGGGYPYSTEFYTTDAEVAVRYFLGAGAGSYRIWVDNRPLSYVAEKPGPGAGNTVWMHLVFPDSRRRLVRIEHTQMYFAQIASASGTTRPPAKEAIRCALVGDSWTAGGADYDGGWPTNLTPVFERLMGWNVLHAGIGGTGYSKPTKFGDAERLASVVGFAPHYVIVLGSVNDKDVNDTALVQSDAAAYYAELATQLPDTKVIVVGPQRYKGGTDPMLGVRDAVKTAAEAAPNVIAFIDPIEEHWINGNGTVTAPNGTGSSDLYIHTDGVHPTLTGAAYWARRMAGAVVHVLESKGIRWFRWSGAEIADPLKPAMTDIITEGLVVEATVESITGLADGALITAFAPARGSELAAFDVRSGEQPTYRVINGTAEIQFPAGKRIVWPTSPWSAPVTTAQGMTVFIVHKANVHGTGSLYVLSAGDGLRPSYNYTTANDMKINRIGTASYVNVTDAVGTTWRIDAYRLNPDGSVHVLPHGGAITSAGNLAGTNGMDKMGINFTSAGAAGWDTSFRHALVYRGALTDQQMTETVTYLHNKWGVTV